MSTKINRMNASKVVLAIASGLLLSTFASRGHATAQNAGSRSFARLCPDHVGGDREFNGHGPNVDAVVTLRRNAGNEGVALDVSLHEIETVSDWTEAQYSHTFSLASSPSGHPYVQIWAPGADGGFAWVTLGSAPTYGSAVVSYADTNHSLDRFPNPQWWVSGININGDTSGNDVGNCTADDAYITVNLPAVWFWYN